MRRVIVNPPEIARRTLGEYLLDLQRRPEAEGDFVLEAPDILAVTVDGRVRARAACVLAANGTVRVTPAARFGGFTGGDASGGALAALDGRGRAWLGEMGKTLALFTFAAAERLVVSSHAIVAVEDTVGFSAIRVSFAGKRPVDFLALSLAGPGRMAFAVAGTLLTRRVTHAAPLFARAGSCVAWSANLEVVGKSGPEGDARLAFAGDGFVMIQAGAQDFEPA